MSQYAINVSGISNCGIDTLAPVGSTFTVSYWAVSSSQPPQLVSANRTIQISDPCPTSDLPYFCQDAVTLNFYCAPLPCGTSKGITRTIVSTPRVILTPLGTSTVFVQFGSLLPFSLAPCPSGLLSNGSLINTTYATCGAIAIDQFPNKTVVADLTPSIQVLSSIYCDPDQPTLCSSCTLDNIVLSGGCSPGVYAYSYQVSNSDGSLTNAASRQVVVYNSSTIVLDGVVVFSAVANATIASTTVSTLNTALVTVNGTSATNYTDAIKNLLAPPMNISSLGVTDGDIDILNGMCSSSSRIKGSSTVYDIACSIRVWDYYPSAVNRSALSAFAATLTAWSNHNASSASAGRRRSLHSELQSLTSPQHRDPLSPWKLEELVSLHQAAETKARESVDELVLYKDPSDLAHDLLRQGAGWYEAELDAEWQRGFFEILLRDEQFHTRRRIMATNISAALANKTNATGRPSTSSMICSI